MMASETSETSPSVLVDKRSDGRIWVITMNRPQRMNAFGDGMTQNLTRIFGEFRDNTTARVAIVTGAGERAFCAGGDLKEVSASRKAGDQLQQQSSSGPRRGLGFVPLSERLELWKPTIAAVNGFAVAGGFMVAMQCDIRIMAEHAKVGIAEARWNMAGAAWMAPLTRQIGLGNALELAMWGDTQLTAQRCYELGWAQRVVPKEQLMDTAMGYAERMLDMAPRAVANIKRMLYRGFNMDPMWSMQVGDWMEQNLQGMQDSVEGPTAFAEKRRPNFIDG
jgi:enoyl-CoA hydratase/carnithine racemase